MKELKRKTFYTILTILSLSVLTLIITYNASKYIEKYNSIVNNLNVAKSQGKNKDTPPSNNEPPSNETEPPSNDVSQEIKFMDSKIYTILIDENNNIKEIINNTNEELDTTKITKSANEILSDNIKDTYIGFLYFNKYSYAYIENDCLIILDASNINKDLLTTLSISVIIFIILEIIIIYLSKTLTTWLIKPAEDTLNKQKEFIADASHELKTPLAVIIASIDAIENNPKEKKWLKNIKIEADRMNKLITNMLELSRSEKIKEELKKEEDISNIVTLSILTFEGIAYEENIELIYHIEDNIKGKVNSEEIHRLVEILLDNAVKHTKGNNKKVILTLENNKDNIILMVTNYGDTIPKGEEEKIFERFYRVDKARNRSDNHFGLGLAIAKNIVNNHNGKITASSDSTSTTFKVVFKN